MPAAFVPARGLPLASHARARLACGRRAPPAAPRRRRRTPAMAAARAPSASDAMLHFVYRVGDLPRTREFLSTLGLRVLREREVGGEKSNVFFGAGTESNAEHCSFELVYNYGVEKYRVGEGFGSIGVAVPDVKETVRQLRAKGFAVVREPWTVSDGKSYLALVEDPTGYRFELQQCVRRDPVCHVTLRVLDLDAAIKFYQAMGLHEVRRHSSEEGRYTHVKLGYGPEDDSTVLQLAHSWDRKEGYDIGDGWGQIAVRATTSVFDSADIMQEAGYAASRAPGPVPGIGTKIVAFRDPVRSS